MHIIASRRRTAHERTSRCTTLRSGRVQMMALVLGLAALAAPAIAMAVVNEPPVLPHAIISFPQRDFVSGSGFGPGQHVTYTVIRNGVTIATSDPVVADAAGLAEVNHPGGGCWLTTTPDLLPGDKVRSTVQETGVQDQTTTANVTAARPTSPSAGTIVVRGTATAIGGGQIPIAQIEQRLVANKDLFLKNGRRTLRASGAGADGKLSYDSATSTSFTATYTGLVAADVTRALDAESRALWLGINPGTGQELTIYENPAAGGPSPPCTAPLASNAITASDHTYKGAPTVNIANSATPLGLSGVAQPDVTSVSVTVTDRLGAPTTPVVVALPGGTVGQTWNAVVSAAQIAALADGTLTASMTYTTAGGTLPGAGLSLSKDTVAPAAPDATPPGGSYTATQSVFLSDADIVDSILYTTNNTTPATAPTANGVTKLYSAAIAVNTSQTLKALAVDAGGNPSAVATNAYLLQAAPRLTPSSIDYGSQAVGTPSPGVLVTMKNTGAASMTISAVGFTGPNPGDAPGDFLRGVSTCTGVTLAPAESCTVDNVRFQPQANGTRTASLTFTDDAPGGSHSVTLTGSGFGFVGAAPAATITPTSLAFGNQDTGTSAVKTVSVKNSGTADLVISTTPVTGADYAKGTIDTCTGQIVVPAATCTIDVRFGPTARGDRFGTLTINDNTTTSPHSVALSGTGTAPLASLTPASMPYTDQLVGTTSAAQTATITNSGNAPMALSVALTGTSPGDYGIASNSCTASLAAAASCSVGVTFKPTATGAHPALLRFSDNSNNVPSTQDVTLSGTGIAPAITATPNPVAFGNSAVGTLLGVGATTVSKTVSVTNSGTAPLSITTSTIGAAATASFPGDYTITSNTCTNTTRAVGSAACSITIRFGAKATGTRNAVLTINSDAPTGPLKVNLGGTGV